MKYKTMKSYHKPHSAFLLICGVCTMIIEIAGAFYTEIEDPYESLYCFGLSIIFIGQFFYCWSDDFVRKKFYTYGHRYDATIIRAEYTITPSQPTCYLIIEFSDGKQILKKRTKAYVGNPNRWLTSSSCSIYEWKGKYMEGDLREGDGTTKTCNIPMTEYHKPFLKDKNYV